jgi:DNA-damage-inducible protein J
MPKSDSIHARIEPKLKEEAETILKELGLNATQAITLFYQQIRLHR